MKSIIKNPKTLSLAILALVFASALSFFSMHRRAQFIFGGALVNVGYFFQDRLHAYDFKHDHNIAPEQVWSEFLAQNDLAASVRGFFPRTSEHPLVAMLVCMDARIDTAELAGDTRRYYYVLRNAGSTIQKEQADMLELAVRNGVEVIVLTRHTDCAAEKVAHDAKLRNQYPHLVSAMDSREKQIQDFMQRPFIQQQIKSDKLLVKQMLIDTRNEHLVVSSTQ